MKDYVALLHSIVSAGGRRVVTGRLEGNGRNARATGGRAPVVHGQPSVRVASKAARGIGGRTRRTFERPCRHVDIILRSAEDWSDLAQHLSAEAKGICERHVRVMRSPLEADMREKLLGIAPRASGWPSATAISRVDFAAGRANRSSRALTTNGSASGRWHWNTVKDCGKWLPVERCRALLHGEKAYQAREPARPANHTTHSLAGLDRRYDVAFVSLILMAPFENSPPARPVAMSRNRSRSLSPRRPSRSPSAANCAISRMPLTEGRIGSSRATTSARSSSSARRGPCHGRKPCRSCGRERR